MSVDVFGRTLYVHHRRKVGCPAVIAVQLKPIHWGWYVETKDGFASLEQVKASSIWEAKDKCVDEWERLKALEQKGG